MLLEDEASFYRQPTAASAWSPEGAIQPRMACSCRSNTPIRVAVVFDPVQGLLLHRLRPQFSAVEMGRFYQHLSISLPWARRIFWSWTTGLFMVIRQRGELSGRMSVSKFCGGLHMLPGLTRPKRSGN